MRFQSAAVRSFAALKGEVLAGLPADRLVVLLGRNESGKSSTRKLLQSVLFGFQPARKEEHPALPWSADGLEIRAVLRDDAGREFEVERNLRSRPKGRLRRGAVVQDLANHALPVLADLDERSFEAVYFFSAAHLTHFSPAVRERLHPRLLGGEWFEGLRPVGSVLDQLERERLELIRSDRRGRPRERVLQEKLQGAQRRRRAADAAEQARRAWLREQVDLALRIEECRTQHARWQRLAELVPVARSLRTLERCRRDIEAWLRAEPGDDVPADPAASLAALDRALAAERSQLHERQVRCRRLRRDGILPPGAEATLGRADEIDALLLGWPPRAERQAEQRAARTRVTALRREIHQWIQEIGVGPPQEQVAAFRRVLRGEERSLRVLAVDLRNLQRQEKLARHPAGRLAERISLGLALIALGGWWAFPDAGVSGPKRLAGLVLALLGGELLRRCVAGRRARREAAGPTRAELRSRVDGWLADLPIRPELKASPTDWLVADLERLRALLRQEQQERESLRIRQRAHAERRRDALQLWHDLGGKDRPTSLPRALRRCQEQARDRWLRARRAEEELPQEEEKCERQLRELRARQDERARIVRTVLAVAREADLAAACEQVKQARLRADEARPIERQLAESYGDRVELLAELAALSGSEELPRWSHADEARFRGEAQQAAEELQTLERRRGELAQLLQQGGPTPADVDGEVAELRAELHAVRSRHDRLTLLQALVREARRHERERRQPDVLQRASGFLAALTAGRYDRLLFDEDHEEYRVAGPALAAGGGEGGSVALAQPLSQGTRDQVHLALRLALADHLDAERGESLPRVLDEAFVHCDPERLDAALHLLADRARTVQCFLLTCHPWLARRAVTEVGAVVVSMDEQGGSRGRAVGGGSGVG